MCELPDGTFVFTETQEECIQMSASCSSRCVGESCYSYRFGLGGVCVANVSNEMVCEMYGQSHSVKVVYSDEGICVLEGITESEDCAKV